MRALILANGDPPPASLLHALRTECDLFIATDGAAATAVALSCTPGVTLGDFDSLPDNARVPLATTELVHAADQDASDLDKAIDYAIVRGAHDIVLTGTLGGRADHALTAISLLVKYVHRTRLSIVEAGQRIWAVAARLDIDGAPGDTVSLIAFGTVEGITTEGLRWPLSNHTLTPGSLGVSNVMVGPRASVAVRSGILIVCHGRPSA